MWLIRISALVVSRRRRRVIVRKYPWGKWSSAVVTYEFNKWTYCSFQKRDYHATLSPVLTPLDALIFGWDHSSSHVCARAFLPFFGPPLCPVSALAFLQHTCNFCEEYNRRKPGPDSLNLQRNNARTHRVRERARACTRTHYSQHHHILLQCFSHTHQPLILSS